jgi:hypothetical protein
MAGGGGSTAMRTPPAMDVGGGEDSKMMAEYRVGVNSTTRW